MLKIFTGLILMGFSLSAYAGCNDSYIATHHSDTGKRDLCMFEDNWPSTVEVLNNWGTKPEWMDDTSFVFMSNQIGNVHLMDLATNQVTNLTGHFPHAGFTRAFRLPSGDLLLTGIPYTGSPLVQTDPLVIYEGEGVGNYTSMFTSAEMFVFKAPFDGVPIALNQHAWEGVAIHSDGRIVWSDTRLPFYGDDIIQTAINYLFGDSSLWSGKIAYDAQGNPSLIDKKRIVSKGDVGAVFFETQNFNPDGKDLYFQAYGIGAEGTGDTYIYNFKQASATIAPIATGYNEWEGVHPSGKFSFYEQDADASALNALDHVDLHFWNFKTHSTQAFTALAQQDYGFIHEPVFSPDGNKILATFLHPDGVEKDSPGYGTGLLLVDYATWKQNPTPIKGKTVTILDAKYGKNGRYCNATNHYANACNGQDSCTLSVNNWACGNPAWFVVKEVTVDYSCGAETITVTAKERSNIRIECEHGRMAP